MKKQPIKIVMIGFNNRALKSFEIFFQNKCSGDFVISGDHGEFPITIVDLDAVNGMKNLPGLRERYREQIILALSILDHDDDQCIVSIKKPLNYKDLMQHLANIKKVITNNDRTLFQTRSNGGGGETVVDKNVAEPGSTKPAFRNVSVSHSTAAASLMTMKSDLHFVGSNQDIDLTDESVRDKILYSPNQRYQSSVVKAVNHARKVNKIVEMICLNTCIVIDPEKNIVITVAGDSLLRPICLLGVEKVDSLIEFDGKYNVDRILKFTNAKKQDLREWSIEAFIWKVVLWSSRGCIPESFDINTPVFLLDWPNFPRLENFPHAMRISALLVQKATIPSEIAKQLNIPQRYVFSFLSAVQAIGMLRVSLRKADRFIELRSIPKKVASKSLLKKLLGRLVGFSDKQPVVKLNYE